MEREFVAQRLVKKLLEAEAAQQDATARMSELLGELISARREMGLSANAGIEQEALIIKAIASGGQTSETLVETHEGLHRLGKALKIRTTGDSHQAVQPETDTSVRTLKSNAA